MPSRAHPDVDRGWIIPIGGKLLDHDILKRFVALSGGASARIAVIPTASNEPDMGTFYELLFARHQNCCAAAPLVTCSACSPTSFPDLA